MKNIRHIAFLILVMCCFMTNYAQEERNDDLGDVSDAFQTNYFEALKQKAIENYDKAIELLLVCKKDQPNLATVHFELGKNYYEIDQYTQAETALTKANELKPNNHWILYELYKTYVAQKNDQNIESTLVQLATLKTKYKDELIIYYFSQRKFNQALTLIDAVDKLKGTNKQRESIRHQIYKYSQNYKGQIDYLNNKIATKTALQSDYIKLIAAYSSQGNLEQAFNTAKTASTLYPDSDYPHLSLYKFYINQNNLPMAIQSLNRVAASTNLIPSDKRKVLHDFFLYTEKNLEQLPVLEHAIKISKQKGFEGKLAQLHSQLNNNNASESYITEAIENNSTNFDDLKTLGNLLLSQKKYPETLTQANKALELYPAQPIFYLHKGKALNQLQKPQEGLDTLLFGLDYLIDNISLEKTFYITIAESYEMLGDTKNQQRYIQKAKKLKIP